MAAAALAPAAGEPPVPPLLRFQLSRGNSGESNEGAEEEYGLENEDLFLYLNSEDTQKLHASITFMFKCGFNDKFLHEVEAALLTARGGESIAWRNINPDEEESRRLLDCIACMRSCGLKGQFLDGVEAALQNALKRGVGAFWRNIHYGEESQRGLAVFESPGAANPKSYLVFGQRFRAERRERLGDEVWLQLREGQWVKVEDAEAVYCISLDEHKDSRGRIPEAKYRGQHYPSGMYTEGFGGSQPFVLVSASGDNHWRELNIEMLFRDIPTATVFEGTWGGDETFTTWVAFYALNVGIHGELQSETPKEFKVTVKNSRRFLDYPKMGPEIEAVRRDIGRAQYKECKWIAEQFERRHFDWNLVTFLTAFQFLRQYCHWTSEDCQRATRDRTDDFLAEDITYPFTDLYKHRAQMLRWAVAEAFYGQEPDVMEACTKIEDADEDAYASLEANPNPGSGARLILRLRDRELLARREHLLARVRGSEPFAAANAVKDAPDDRAVVLEAVAKYGSALQHASAALQNDRDVVLAAVRHDPNAIKFASERLQADPNVAPCPYTPNPPTDSAKRLVRSANFAQDHLLKKLISDLEDRQIMAKDAVQKAPHDRKLVLIAVKQSGPALEFASDALKDDAEVVCEACKKTAKALTHASDRLKNLVIGSERLDGKEAELARIVAESLFKQCSKPLAGADANKRYLVLRAVAENGLALEHASATLRGDPEVVLAAVRSSGQALRYASSGAEGESLNDDVPLVTAAVEQDGRALEFASDRLKDNEVLVRTAVQKDGSALEFASSRLKDRLSTSLSSGRLKGKRDAAPATSCTPSAMYRAVGA